MQGHSARGHHDREASQGPCDCGSPIEAGGPELDLEGKRHHMLAVHTQSDVHSHIEEWMIGMSAAKKAKFV